ncbi:hypothetical protein ACIPRL_08100 [Streptomyces sp. NPDC090085]|uniref:RapZ C-terminal domain-containing protein n=1 Tax=Streptomyces sp. NPDC090085 TaxID=3365943 RepID=UPI003809B062
MSETKISIVSFGYGHTGLPDEDGTPLEVPRTDVTLDLRRILYNPHLDPAMRFMTGLDEAVYEYVMATPGAQLLADQTALSAHITVTQGPLPGGLSIGVGCSGGRHRAVGVARRIGFLLENFTRAGGYGVELVHRDVHRAVLPSRVHKAGDGR